MGLCSALASIGVEKIETVDVPIDTNIHEIILADENHPEGMVCEILQAGYRIGDRVLRPAKVKAGSKNKKGKDFGFVSSSSVFGILGVDIFEMYVL